MYLEVCRKSLAHPKNAGVIGDNPTGMKALRGRIVEMSPKKTSIACIFHVLDLTAGDVMGKTGAHTVKYNIKDLLDSGTTSLTILCKAMVHHFAGRHIPHGLLKGAIRERNIVLKAEHGSRAELVTTLRPMGATRKTSVANMFASVHKNQLTMQTAVNCKKHQDYVASLGREDRDKVQALVRFINHDNTFALIGKYAVALNMLQITQRVVEMRNKVLGLLWLLKPLLTLPHFQNLGDAVHDVYVLYTALNSVDLEVAAKEAFRESLAYRFKETFYSPSVALACTLDSRFKEHPTMLDVIFRAWGLPYKEDAENVLDKKISGLDKSLQHTIKRQYQDWMGDRVFAWTGEDAQKLDDASNMPGYEWAKCAARKRWPRPDFSRRHVPF
jgi:hypothetical protein